MTKAELVEKISQNTGTTNATAEKALNSVITEIKKSLKRGEKVTLVGFGTFSVGKRKARKGINPLTGETINIKAAKVAKFSAGKALKDAVK
jgi:DNA-binding protein HU-beta